MQPSLVQYVMLGVAAGIHRLRFTSPRWGEVGEQRSCEPGEGDQTYRKTQAPHPNPLPNGERESTAIAATVEATLPPSAIALDHPRASFEPPQWGLLR